VSREYVEYPVHLTGSKKRPTQRQFLVLQFVAEYVRDNRYPPSLRDIGKQFGISSTNGVQDHLNRLEYKGLLFQPRDMASRHRFPTDKGYELLGWKRCDCGAWRPT
jgi:repressor LexA